MLIVSQSVIKSIVLLIKHFLFVFLHNSFDTMLIIYSRGVKLIFIQGPHTAQFDLMWAGLLTRRKDGWTDGWTEGRTKTRQERKGRKTGRLKKEEKKGGREEGRKEVGKEDRTEKCKEGKMEERQM